MVSKRWEDIASNLNRIYHDEDSQRVLDAYADRNTSGLKKAAMISLAAGDISFLKIDNIKRILEKSQTIEAMW